MCADGSIPRSPAQSEAVPSAKRERTGEPTGPRRCYRGRREGEARGPGADPPAGFGAEPHMRIRRTPAALVVLAFLAALAWGAEGAFRPAAGAPIAIATPAALDPRAELARARIFRRADA